MKKSKDKKVESSAFDGKFDDNNEDIIEYLDIKSAKTRYPVQRISIDFPKGILEGIDLEAAKIGVTRTSLIKMWVAQKLSHFDSQRSNPL